jgi:hypothetical protein
MAARNRVTPLGEIEAFPLRGAWTGNRGILHRGHEIVRFHAGDLWITCALAFRGRRHEQWQPHHYTFLYFHDEAVSFAAAEPRTARAVRAEAPRPAPTNRRHRAATGSAASSTNTTSPHETEFTHPSGSRKTLAQPERPVPRDSF